MIRLNNDLRRKPALPDPIVAIAARFARQLAELRAERGETQKQFASRIGMTESMISRFESGNHLPNLTTLCRIADGFDRRLEIVFHEHEHRHRDGTAHAQIHGHGDVDHMHDHDREPN